MKKLFKNKYRIKSNRHPNWDYNWNGYYFITICTHDQINHFGKIIDHKIQLNNIGTIIDHYWNEIPKHNANVFLDEYIIMPNHFHGIIVLDGGNDIDDNKYCGRNGRDAINRVSTSRNTNTKTKNVGGITGNKNPMLNNSLSRIIRWFKGRTTFEIRNSLKKPLTIWQPRFHDHIIRNNESLECIRKYIIDNPKNWDKDEYN